MAQLFVYSMDGNGNILSPKLVSDDQHLIECIKHLKDQYGGTVHYNVASFCLSGYLVQGEYLGPVKPMEIRTFYDENRKATSIDVYVTDDDNEEGECAALVYDNGVIESNGCYGNCPEVKNVIQVILNKKNKKKSYNFF